MDPKPLLLFFFFNHRAALTVAIVLLNFFLVCVLRSRICSYYVKKTTCILLPHSQIQSKYRDEKEKVQENCYFPHQYSVYVVLSKNPCFSMKIKWPAERCIRKDVIMYTVSILSGFCVPHTYEGMAATCISKMQNDERRNGARWACHF